MIKRIIGQNCSSTMDTDEDIQIQNLSEIVSVMRDESPIRLMNDILYNMNGTSLYTSQREIIKRIDEEYRSIIIKSRGVGFTTLMKLYTVAKILKTGKKTNFLMIFRNSEQAARMFKEYYGMITDLQTELPFFFNYIRSDSDKKTIFLNNSEIFFRSVHSDTEKLTEIDYDIAIGDELFFEKETNRFLEILCTSNFKMPKFIFGGTKSKIDFSEYISQTFRMLYMHWWTCPKYNRYLTWTKENTRKDREYTCLCYDMNTIDDNGKIHEDIPLMDVLYEDGWKPNSPWYEKINEACNNIEEQIKSEIDCE